MIILVLNLIILLVGDVCQTESISMDRLSSPEIWCLKIGKNSLQKAGNVCRFLNLN